MIGYKSRRPYMDYRNSNPAELAAAINAAASIMAKGKTVEEIEMLAVLFDMLSDTLFAIVLLQKKQDRLREKFMSKGLDNPNDVP